MQYLANGALIHLECFTTRQNLRIKDDGRIDGNGGVGAPATFMVHNTGNGKIKFQTQGASGKFIGIMPTGQIMSVFNSKEAELVVVPSSTGGDMIFIANNWPAGFYVGVNPMGNPVMCNNMSVGQFGAFTVKPSGKVMSPGAAAAGMAVGMAAGMVNAVAGAMGMGVTVSTQPSYPPPPPPPPPQHHHMPPPQHQHYQPPPPMHGNCHVVVTPPAPRYGRDYSKAKLLVAKYGDFASKRLVDATRRLSSCIDRQGNLTIGPNYNGVFSDPAPGVLKALLLVWVINDKFNDRDIHWGILKENETQVAELDSISFGHPVTQFPAGIYGDFASGRYTDIRPVFAREFRFMTLNCSSYNQLFGDPAPGVRKALIVFYDSPCYKYMNISGENDIKTFSANDKSNEVIFDAFRH